MLFNEKNGDKLISDNLDENTSSEITEQKETKRKIDAECPICEGGGLYIVTV